MADKKYIDFPLGTYDDTKIILQADPITGVLEKVFLPNLTIPTLISAFTNDAGYITSVSFSSITGKPTTLSGYGITDAYPLSGNPSGFISSVPAQSWSSITGKPTFATVATSGSYTDLINQPAAYSLPTASATILGGIKVGSGLSIASGVLNAITSGTVTSFAFTNSTGITGTVSTSTTTPTLSLAILWTGIGSKPTTLSGYGITDAYPLSGNPSGFLTSVPAQAWSSITGKPTFATVATSGSYNDLSSLPTIPQINDSSSTTTSTYSSSKINSLISGSGGGDMLASVYDPTGIHASAFDYNNFINTPTIPSAYTLPTASSSVLGGVKIGTGITISSGVISATPAFSAITSKPTTLSGYGITDSIVLTSGSYANPTWITAIPYSILSGTAPTWNQNTTGSAATLTTGRTIGITGDVTYTSPSFNGSANVTASATVTKINGTALSGLATGILKNTTSTGVPSIAVAGDFPILNQSTTGNAATATALQNARTIAGVSFNGTANISLNNNAITNGAGYITSVPAQTWSSITGKPTTLAGYGITDVVSSFLGIIGNAVDLNTYTTSGWLLQATDAYAASGTNYPAPYAGKLEVVSGAGFVFQTYTIYSGVGVNEQKYYRGFYNTSWSTWKLQLSSTSGVSWSSITGTPTTLSGYGITNAVDLTSAQTITGVKTFSNSPIVTNITNSAYGGSIGQPGVAFGTIWVDAVRQNSSVSSFAIGQNGSDFLKFHSSSASFASAIYIGSTTTVASGASLQIIGGTTTNAPLKLTAGTNLTTPANGAVEYDGTHLYFTTGSTRTALDNQASSGTYTPTFSNLSSNITTATPVACFYQRIGSIVSISGTFYLQVSASGSNTFNVTLPITSSFTSPTDGVGIGASQAAPFVPVSVLASVGTSLLAFDVVTAAEINGNYNFQVTYIIK